MSRQLREKEAYDRHALQRESHEARFPRSIRFHEYLAALVTKYMQACQGARVLEIGSNAWTGYLHQRHFQPEELVCINISEEELEAGRRHYEKLAPPFPIEFILMDAHDLQLAPESFDVVFGGAILHHLDLQVALDQIYRVAKPSGEILFHEPLGSNPFAALVRRLTPSARTADERPLSARDLRLIRSKFETQLHFLEFTCVLPNAITASLLGSQSKAVDALFYGVDRLASRIPLLPLLYRDVLIHGRKK
ncbi:MAG: class I SAM-dependent methyltransferase [Deltaproteobacteria bacterium]|nr:class I SAM-dependent methyltransferase [Deltaproteobacteria bacterium]MBW2419101.1 class I SAM-dependent methyltransferase [Deltaproteobacteria bacterium]